MSTVILNSQLLLCRCDAHDVLQFNSAHNHVVLDAVRLVDNSGFRVQQVTRARRSHILRNSLLVNQLAVHHVDAFGVVDDAVEVFRALAAVFNQAVARAVVLVVVFLRFEALHSSSVVSVRAFCFATHLVPVDVAARVVKQLDAVTLRMDRCLFLAASGTGVTCVMPANVVPLTFCSRAWMSVAVIRVPFCWAAIAARAC